MNRLEIKEGKGKQLDIIFNKKNVINIDKMEKNGYLKDTDKVRLQMKLFKLGNGSSGVRTCDLSVCY